MVKGIDRASQPWSKSIPKVVQLFVAKAYFPSITSNTFKNHSISPKSSKNLINQHCNYGIHQHPSRKIALFCSRQVVLNQNRTWNRTHKSQKCKLCLIINCVRKNETKFGLFEKLITRKWRNCTQPMTGWSF